MSTRDEILARLGEVRPAALPPVFEGPNRVTEFEKAAAALGIEFVSEAPHATPCSFEAEYFVSTAICAIAETGSVVLDATEPRLGSLLPPTHYVIVSRSRIVGTLEDAFAQGIGRNAVIITGPSRTADIEGVLVRGVHGPGRLLFVMVD